MPMPSDMTRLERVLAALNHQPVDRCVVLEQLSYNPGVIADWTGKPIVGFDYTLDDICAVIRQTRALQTGGMFVASSSEINPPIPPENFRAMVETVWEEVNNDT